MTPSQLDAAIASTGHSHLRALTAEDNPDVAQRDAYRLLVARLAGPTAYPPLAAQAVGLAGSLATWLRAGCPITPRAERERRRGVCTGGDGRPACDQFDAERRRCRACGCFGDLKPWLGTAYCPLSKW